MTPNLKIQPKYLRHTNIVNEIKKDYIGNGKFQSEIIKNIVSKKSIKEKYNSVHPIIIISRIKYADECYDEY